MNIWLCCGLLFCATTLFAENAIEGLSAVQILQGARALFPKERMTIEGTLTTAEARGLNEIEHAYTLTMDWTGVDPKATCELYDLKKSPLTGQTFKAVLQTATITRTASKAQVTLTNSAGQETTLPRFNLPVAGSDVTWMDLTLDYLWWQQASILSEETLAQRQLSARTNGRNCVIIEALPPMPIPGCTAVLLWIDKATGNLLQAQQLGEQQQPARELWVQRIGREEGRWVPRVFTIRTYGLKRRTSLHLQSIRTDSFTSKHEVSHDE